MSNVFSLVEFAKSFKQHKWLVLAICAACLIGSAFAPRTLSGAFRGECVLSLKNLRNEQVTAKDLVDMVGTISRDKMAAIFPRSNSVQAIALSELKGSNNKIRVAITARQREDIPPALDEIVEYLNDTPLLKNTREQQRTLLMGQIEELTRTIEKSERTQALIDRLLEQGKLTPVGFNPVDLTKHISDFRVEKQGLEQALGTVMNVQIAQRIFVSLEPIGPTRLTMMMTGGGLGLLIGLFLARLLDALRVRPQGAE